MSEIITQDYFLLFAVIAIGYFIGRIQVFGFSLDVSAVLFVAMIFGYYGFSVPPILQYIGLLFFIYTVGIQAGPGFFDSFKSHGRQYAFLAFIIVGSGALLTWLFTWILGYDKNLTVGLFTGALTSTPGLATAINESSSPLASIGYSIAYPFGVIGVILFIRLAPKMLRVNLSKEEENLKQRQLNEHPELHRRHYVVQNEGVVGKTIREINLRRITGAVVSRILHEGVATTANPETVFAKGDIIRAVGTLEALDRVESVIGPATKEKIVLSREYDVRPMLITNKDIHNKRLGDIEQIGDLLVTVTRVRRSGIDITPTPSFKLKLGDKIMVAARKDDMQEIARLFGNDDQKLSDTDIMPIALGIILGAVIGQLTVVFDDYAFSLGLTGGVLLIALILGRTGRTGPIIWTLSSPANQLIRQLGLALFLVAVGADAGKNIVEVIGNYGMQMLAVGAVITLVPMIITLLISRFVYKTNIFELLGAIAGGMTSTPGLAAADAMTKNNVPAVAYATIYPIAMVFVIIAVKLLCI
ncbi:MAG TPA: aspartate:alanine exchanger family transporter [Salinivirgaceae bacterium]|nr:aspartate:alanine exchanger family transporter [Salinivirgaceae bacterium]HQA76528.1 aspartate:alanine exchanger family transporter [Salinivirgaceae bacterium]